MNTLSTLFSKLTLDELTQLSGAVDPSLNTLASGDGQTSTIRGAWLNLQSAFLANASIFQKIGVNDLAAALIALKADALANAQESLNPPPKAA